MTTKLKSLELINPHESGLISFDRSKFEKILKNEIEKRSKPTWASGTKDFIDLLSLLAFESFNEIETRLSERPDLEAQIEIKAIKILTGFFLGKDLKDYKLFYLNNPNSVTYQKITFKLASFLIDLYDLLIKNLFNFSNEKYLQSNFYKLVDIVPPLKFIYSQYVLENKLSERYFELYEILKSEIEINDIYEQIFDWELERLRLLAFYFRRIGDLDRAESYMCQFRESFRFKNEKSIEIKSIGNQNLFIKSELFDNWKNILEECDEIQNEIIQRAGLESNTCEYFNCADCCKNAFPVMSFTEFKYLENWLKENHYPVEEIYEKSRIIQEQYKALNGEELKIIDKSIPENRIRGIENPTAFRYECPFLKDNRCSCYEARPLLCRAFGMSTDNDISIKTCKYYLAQYQNASSPRNERFTYDLRPAQSLARISDAYATDGKELSGTIVAWFTEKHQEN